jgi:DNA-binding transcriptional regulator GbsR (MarR family)
MEKIYINIFGENSKIHDYYIKSYKDIIEKYNVKVFFFSKGYRKEYFINKDKFEKSYIFLFKYSIEEDIMNKIENLKKKYEIIYINTFSEFLIPLSNKIKKHI